MSSSKLCALIRLCYFALTGHRRTCFIVYPRYTHWILICLSIWLLSTMPHTFAIKCCVPNCGKTRLDGTILHKFPNPETDPDRFRTWLYAIGGDILALENKTIFKYRRVCHHHFQTRYHTTSNRLCANAVPTLNLPGFYVTRRRTLLQEIGNINVETSQAEIPEEINLCKPSSSKIFTEKKHDNVKIKQPVLKGSVKCGFSEPSEITFLKKKIQKIEKRRKTI